MASCIYDCVVNKCQFYGQYTDVLFGFCFSQRILFLTHSCESNFILHIMAKKKLDDVDIKIINALQQNARVRNAEIARQIGMAPSAVLERIRKLETSGVVQGYEARVDPKAIGQGLTAFTFVRSEEGVGSTRAGEELAKIPEVLEVHHTAGHDCYLLKVRVADTAALGQLLRRIGQVDTVRDTRSTIVLTTVKETLELPLGGSPEDI
jgi:Lrp/AsnC family leucine-responsive transcriptional regulator